MGNEVSKDMKFEFALVDVDSINVDTGYQRTTDEKRVASASKAFSSGAIKAISLSQRTDGSLWCYDGQHTLEILRRLGAKVIPAVIVPGDQQKEAEWFVLMNGAGVRKATARDTQKAAVVAGMEGAIEVQELLNSYGLVIAKGGAAKGTTSAIGSIKSWAKKDMDRLVRAMGMIDRLWRNEDHAWTQIVLRGAWDVAGTDQLDAVEKGLAKARVTPRRVLDTAGGLQSATGLVGGGSGYAKRAFFALAKVKEST